MKKALPWIIFIAILFLVVALVQTSIWTGILFMFAVCGVLLLLLYFYIKASRIDASEHDKRLAYVSNRALFIASICLLVIGIVLAVVGFTTSKYVGDEVIICGWCGGTGRVSSGKICGLCHGLGVGFSPSYKYANYTWYGIYMAVSGAAILFVILRYCTPTPKPSPSINTNKNATRVSAPAVSTPPNKPIRKQIPAISFEPFKTKAADFTISLGHWKEKDSKQKAWISNEADNKGAWTMRCLVNNKNEKTIRNISLTVSLYNNEGTAVSEHEKYETARTITPGETHSVCWNLNCRKTAIRKGVLESADIQFADGTTRSFSRSLF